MYNHHWHLELKICGCKNNFRNGYKMQMYFCVISMKTQFTDQPTLHPLKGVSDPLTASANLHSEIFPKSHGMHLLGDGVLK